MVRTQISFDEKEYRRAQQEARRRGVSLAALCRQSMKLLLAEAEPEHGKPWLRYTGIIDDGGRDDSNNDKIDAVVYGKK